MRQMTALFASVALATAAAAVSVPAAHAQDMGTNPITEFFDGLGMGDKEKPDIDYKERAPLVPPSATGNLPAPQTKTSARDAQWPTDPDVTARAKDRAARNVVPTESHSYQMDRSPRVDPDELGARRVRGAGLSTTAQGTQGDNQIMRASRDELEQRPINQVELQNTSRNRLTDPPTGYMVGTGGTAAAPAPEQKPWYKKMFGGS